MNSYFRKRAFLVLLLSFVESLLEFIGIAAFIPFVSLALMGESDNSVNQIMKSWINTDDTFWLLVYASSAFFLILILKNILVTLINSVQADFLKKIQTHVISTNFNNAWHHDDYVSSNLAVRDIYNVPKLFSVNLMMNLLLLVSESIILIFILIALIVFNAQLFISMILIVGPVIMLFIRLIRKKVSYYDKRIKNIAGDVIMQVNELFFGKIDVLISGSKRFFTDKFKGTIGEESHLQGRKFVISQLPKRVIEFGVLLAAILFIVSNFYSVGDKELIIQNLAVFGTASFKAIPSINRILSSTLVIKALNFTLDDVDFDEMSDKKQSDGIISDFRKEISLTDIEFRYGEKIIFSGLNLTIKKGEIIGIQGESGAGKSTLIKILLGLLKPMSGSFEVDGRKAKASSVEWQKQIGYVAQEVFVWDTTVKANIALGISEDEIDEILINKVIEDVSLDTYVKELPNDINQIIGERGNVMSGGQKQRLGIARALYRNTPILILDEITSALDPTTENRIYELIKRISKDKTTIIVSHKENIGDICDSVYSLSANGLFLKEAT